MEELGILKFEDGILTITSVKSILTNSSIYNFVEGYLNNKE